MGFLLALDQGTTSSRAILFDLKGKAVAISQKEFPQYFPSPGWVEHDAEEIWASQLFVARDVLKIAKVDARDVLGIGITNQRETTVIWERATSKPICKAIVWQDRRTTAICEEMKSFEPVLQKKTGLILDPYFSATKIKWILENVAGAKEMAERGDLCFGTIDSWLVWNLTGGALHITDASNASRTLLCNLKTSDWDLEILKIFDVPKKILPKIVSSSSIYGKTKTSLFSSEIPICSMIGDQQAALFGEMCKEKGQAKITYGTGAFLLYNTGNEIVISSAKLLSTIAWKIGDEITYALEGSLFIAGAAIQWLRDNLKLIAKSSDIDSLAASVPDSGDVYFVPAFTGLGAPYWDPRARGTILGISRGTTGAHLARATLESIAFGVADILEEMEKEVGVRAKELRVDGGAANSDLLMQIQSDLIQTVLLRPKNRELTAWGAAALAANALKIPIDLNLELDQTFRPKMTVQEAKKRRDKWQEAVKRAKSWI